MLKLCPLPCHPKAPPIRGDKTRSRAYLEKAPRVYFSHSPRLFRGCARPFVGKPRPLAALFRAGDGEGDEAGKVIH